MNTQPDGEEHSLQFEFVLFMRASFFPGFCVAKRVEMLKTSINVSCCTSNHSRTYSMRQTFNI